ncbi:hypothetical protein [Roseateles sp.]|uniref:hypothetical protein n=1 Tax=Roseateles sp. TaxID=1971397 RepID=UPI0025F47336|nr:hypothetical protein [Roseateles sp.]MBV8035914.1 hypothetical protein [Roseateles sp.]
MSKNAPSPLSARPLPVAEDQHVDADLDVALSTPLTLVVNAQLELADLEQRSVQLALVIPRSQCRGERPRLAALLDAAQAAVARATRGGTLHQPRRVLTQVDGEPYLIPLFEAA